MLIKLSIKILILMAAGPNICNINSYIKILDLIKLESQIFQ